MPVVPVAQLVADHSSNFSCGEFTQQGFVYCNTVLISYSTILRPMLIILPVHLYPYFFGREMCLQGKIADLSEQFWVGYWFELVEEDGHVGVDLHVDDGGNEGEDEQEEVEPVSALLHQSQVAI